MSAVEKADAADVLIRESGTEAEFALFGVRFRAGKCGYVWCSREARRRGAMSSMINQSGPKASPATGDVCGSTQRVLAGDAATRLRALGHHADLKGNVYIDL